MSRRRSPSARSKATTEDLRGSRQMGPGHGARLRSRGADRRQAAPRRDRQGDAEVRAALYVVQRFCRRYPAPPTTKRQKAGSSPGFSGTWMPHSVFSSRASGPSAGLRRAAPSTCMAGSRSRHIHRLRAGGAAGRARRNRRRDRAFTQSPSGLTLNRPSSISNRAMFWRVCDWNALRPEIQLSSPALARSSGSTLRIVAQPSGSNDQRNSFASFAASAPDRG